MTGRGSGFGEAGDRFMGFQQKLVQIEPFLAVEVLREGYAPAHIADGRGEVAPGDAEGVGPRRASAESCDWSTALMARSRASSGARSDSSTIPAERGACRACGYGRFSGVRDVGRRLRQPARAQNVRWRRKVFYSGSWRVQGLPARRKAKGGARTTFRKPWKLRPVPTRRRPPCRSWCPVCCGSERGEASGLG